MESRSADRKRRRFGEEWLFIGLGWLFSFLLFRSGNGKNNEATCRGIFQHLWTILFSIAFVAINFYAVPNALLTAEQACLQQDQIKKSRIPMERLGEKYLCSA